MSAQLLASQAAAENAPTNDMQALEEQANKLSEEAAKNQPAPSKSVLFVRGEDTQPSSVDEVERVENPEELDIDEGSSSSSEGESDNSDSDSEDGEEGGKKGKDIKLEQKQIPDEVFGGIKR